MPWLANQGFIVYWGRNCRCSPLNRRYILVAAVYSHYRFMQEGICRFCRVVVEFLRMYADFRNSSPILGSIGIMIEGSLN
ncbi:hypothetical protein P8452_50688 [Trifolium repens]|nr:hypothetical protein P8452_50688 [Trifolium repens]